MKQRKPELAARLGLALLAIAALLFVNLERIQAADHLNGALIFFICGTVGAILWAVVKWTGME